MIASPDPHSPSPPGASDEVGDIVEDVLEDVPGGDTTVRRPRVPAPPDPVALVDTDHADDTVIVRRGAPRRGASGASPEPVTPDETTDETTAGSVAAYPSRAAAPVRGSRKGQASSTEASAEPGERGMNASIPDASGIRRSLRARARRRLAALVATIVVLVVVLLTALAALVFAAGV